MTERLETIKELVRKIESILYDEWRQQELTNLIESLYYDDHVDWLINRVEELEKELTHQAEHFDICYYVIEKEKKVVEEQNKRYKQALEFYADEKNHEREWDTFTDSGVEKSEVMKDGGEKARQALKEKGGLKMMTAVEVYKNQREIKVDCECGHTFYVAGNIPTSTVCDNCENVIDLMLALKVMNSKD